MIALIISGRVLSELVGGKITGWHVNLLPKLGITDTIAILVYGAVGASF